MEHNSDSEASGNHQGAAYAWRPVAMLMLVLAGLIYVLQSDLLRTAVRSIVDGALR